MVSFPTELSDMISSHYERDRSIEPTFYSKANGDTLVRNLYDRMSDVLYSFTDNLVTGHYALYAHEAREADVSGYNCTTIVPSMYLYAQHMGLSPQIVQFFNFKDVQISNSVEDEVNSPSHFSLILSKDSKRYLFDPFFHVAARILEEGPHHLKLAKGSRSTTTIRHFEDKLEYSEHDFASMMSRLKDDGPSLDMLVCGQRLFRDWEVHASRISGMVYFQDPNEVAFRFEIPQMGIRTKVLMMRQRYDTTNAVWDSSIEMYLARDCYWDSMNDPILVGSFHSTEIAQWQRLLGQLGHTEHFPRYQSLLMKKPMVDLNLLHLSSQATRRLGPDRYAKLLPIIEMRGRYEFEKPELEYLYPLELRASFYMDVQRRETEILTAGMEATARLNLVESGLLIISPQERRILRSKAKELRKKSIQTSKELDAFHLYLGKNRVYHRTMDKVLFARDCNLSMQGGSRSESQPSVCGEQEALEGMLGLGYMATVADFFPYVHALRDYFSFTAYKDILARKIQARSEINSRTH